MMTSRIKSILLGNWGGRVGVTTVVISALIIIVRQFGAFQGAELRNYDGLISGRQEQAPDDRILVVKIKEEDLKKLQEPFVYDDTLADAITNLQQYQPRAIGIDIDRSIPMPKTEKRVKLEQVLKEPNVTAVCALSGLEFEGSPPPKEIAPSQVGFADIPEDADGVMRRALLISAPPPPKEAFTSSHLCNDSENANDLPSFAFLTALMYLEADQTEFPDGVVGITQEKNPRLRIGKTIVNRLTDQSGGYQGWNMGTYSILIDYRHRKEPAPSVTLGELLANQVSPELIRDKIILIGYDTIAIPDTFLTPYSQGDTSENAKMPGVVLHAQIVSQILDLAYGKRKPIGYAPQPIEWLWILLWSFIGGLGTHKTFKHLWQVGIVELGAIGFLILIVKVAMGSASLWLPLPPALWASLLTTVGVILLDRVPTVQKLLKISIDIDWEQVRKEADRLVSLSGGVSAQPQESELSAADLEEAEQKAKQSYLETLQQKAKQRRKKKPVKSTPAAPLIAPEQKVETEQSLFSRLQNQISNLKERLSSRIGDRKVKETENVVAITATGSHSGTTLEQQAELAHLEQYIEQVLSNARITLAQVRT